MEGFDQGYDNARFEISVDENYHCPICMNVLKDPVQCRRNEHYFCTSCIKKHLQQNSQSCPSCREELTLDTLNRCPRIVTRYLSNLKIRCDFFERGCRETINLGDLESHVATCGFSPVRCSNEGCTKEVNIRDKIHHETEVCEFRKVKCHDCAEMRKEIEDMKVKMNEIQDQLNQVRCNQEEVVKNFGALVEIKDQLQVMNELKDVLLEMKEATTNSKKQAIQAPTELPSFKARGDIIVAGGISLVTERSLDTVECLAGLKKHGYI